MRPGYFRKRLRQTWFSDLPSRNRVGKLRLLLFLCAVLPTVILIFRYDDADYLLPSIHIPSNEDERYSDWRPAAERRSGNPDHNTHADEQRYVTWTGTVKDTAARRRQIRDGVVDFEAAMEAAKRSAMQNSDKEDQELANSNHQRSDIEEVKSLQQQQQQREERVEAVDTGSGEEQDREQGEQDRGQREMDMEIQDVVFEVGVGSRKHSQTLTTCWDMYHAHHVVIGHSWGSLSLDKQWQWNAANCDSQVQKRLGVMGFDQGDLAKDVVAGLEKKPFQNVQVRPTSGEVDSCEALMRKYLVQPGLSWGTLPPQLQLKWSQDQCDVEIGLNDQKVSIDHMDCTAMRQRFQVHPGASWGALPHQLQAM